MGRQPCCDKVGLKKGPWSAEEDQKLITFIITHGHCCWRAVPKLAGLLRCGKSCRLRWTNYLRPDLKRGILSESEEQMIIDLHAKIGNRWSKIASQLPGRTDNEIKNYWNTHIKKKLKKMGIDPVSHKPLTDSSTSDNNDATTTDITLEDDKPATNRSKDKGSEEGKKRKRAKDEGTKSTTTKNNSAIEVSISSRSMEESGITDESSKSHMESVKTEDMNRVINVNETMVTEFASCNNAHASLESMLFDETTSVYLPDAGVSSSSVVDSRVSVSVSDEGLMDYVKHDEDPFADSFFSGSNLGFAEFPQDQPPHRIGNEIDFLMPFGGLDLAIEEEDALNAVINGVPENLSWSTSTQQQVQIPDLDVPLWHDSFHSNGYGWDADIASLEHQQFPPPYHNPVSHFPSHMFY